MNANLLLVYGLTSFVTSFLVFPVLIKILHFFEVFDRPGSHKIHDRHTPSLGGIGIAIGFALTAVIAVPLIEFGTWKIFFISLSLIFITGLRDDVLVLSPRQKLVSQLLPVFLLVILGNTQLSSFYDISAFRFSEYAAWGITIFTITILTNAYNLIDGIDGLAGTVAAIGLAWFGLWFLAVDKYMLALLAITFFGATLAFLFFNWQPAKIFMGDTGALTLGFLLSFLTVHFINANFALPQAHPFRFAASISTAVGVFIIPIFDTTRVILIRLSQGRSPFHADKNHLHHRLLSLGFSHARAVLALGVFNVFILSLTFFFRSQPDQVILPVVVVVCIAAHLLLRQYQKLAHGKSSTAT